MRYNLKEEPQENAEVINRITREFDERAQDDADRKIVRASDLLKRKV